MGARVAVASASHASSAGRSGGAGAAAREAGPSADNGFSSQLSAAARQPTTPDPASGTRPEPAKSPEPARAPEPASPKGAGSASAATANQTRVTTSDQAQNAAATVIEADASSIDADLATQEGKAPDRSAGKSRSDDGQSSDDQAASAIAGGFEAAALATTAMATMSMATTATTAMASRPAASAVSAAPTAPTDAAVSNAIAGAARQSLQLGADSLQLSAATGESSSPVTSDSPQPQPQPTSATTANGLPQMMRGLSEAVTPSGAVERTISLPVSDGNWGSAVGNQVQWMVNGNIQSATLQVSPEHLGPVEVRIDVQSSQVNVSFTAAHPDTRGALEQSVPQLRAMLAAGGLTLGHTTVQQEARSNSQYPHSFARGSANSSQTVGAISIPPTRGLGLIDEYA